MSISNTTLKNATLDELEQATKHRRAEEKRTYLETVGLAQFRLAINNAENLEQVRPIVSAFNFQIGLMRRNLGLKKEKRGRKSKVE